MGESVKRRTKKQCYYEVLDVQKDASEAELKKSYRMLALRYHPDKNPDNAEEAATKFKILQEAYQVLINPQERSWYDKHKDLILAGGDRDSIVDQCYDVFPFFTSFCYSGYNDGENGFYSVYRNVFIEIVKDDLPHREESDDESPPSFGCSSSSADEVRAFYAYWESYCTPRSFNCADEYNILEAPNRRIARLMEKENKKLREAKKKERNEVIRVGNHRFL